jgi:hypothetical protein
MSSCTKNQLSVHIVCGTTIAFIKRCSASSAISEMVDFRERACIKFCFKLGNTATECYEMLTAFGEQAMGFIARSDIRNKAEVVSIFFEVQANIKSLFLVDTHKSGHEHVASSKFYDKFHD